MITSMALRYRSQMRRIASLCALLLPIAVAQRTTGDQHIDKDEVARMMFKTVSHKVLLIT